MPDKRLVVIGDGPDFAKVQAKAGSNVQLLGLERAASSPAAAAPRPPSPNAPLWTHGT